MIPAALTSGKIGGVPVGPGDVIQLKVHGLREVFDRVKELGPAAVEAFAESLHEEAEALMDIVKDERIPVKTGNLRSSGFAPPPVVSADYVEQVIGFGGPGEDYALPVHEIPPPPAKSVGGRSARHEPPHGKGGGWKYLEEPFNERQSGLVKRVADSVADRMGL